MYHFAIVVLLLLAAGGAAGQQLEASYRLAIGSENQLISKGQVWLYGAGWGWVNRVQVGEIRDGQTTLRVTPEMIPASFRDSNQLDALFLAVETADGRWFRSSPSPADSYGQSIEKTDIGDFFSGDPPLFILRLESLGSIRADPDGIRFLVLDDYVDRRITFLNPSGSPVTGLTAGVETLVWQGNHCGNNQSYTSAASPSEPHLGRHTTASNGTIIVRAQRVPLELRLMWAEPVGDGSSWPRLRLKEGWTTSSETNLVVKGRWGDPAHRQARIRLTDADGRPVPQALMTWKGSLGECGVFDRGFGPSDSNGVILFEAPMELTEWIEVSDSESPARIHPRKLTDSELGQLLETSQATITVERW